MEIGLLLLIVVLLLANVYITFTKKTTGIAELEQAQQSRFIEMKSLLEAVSRDAQRIEHTTRNEIARNRDEGNNALKANREEISNSFRALGEAIKNQLDIFSERLQQLSKTNEDKLTQIQEQLNTGALANRKELTDSLKNFQESFAANVREFNELQRQKFDSLLQKQGELNTTTETRLNSIRETIEGRLKTLQDENVKKLDEMRATVDEKLQATVEKRFNESFKMISERLEQVHKGLGEMQTLASGVGDLKKVLTNVKTRGTLGEIQLAAILEQFLAPEQYEHNAMVKQGSLERVEFAIKLPDKNMHDREILLPIDSKFPIEDYQRMIDAHEKAENYTVVELDALSKQFENAIKKNAKDIRDKYINPPFTTDFAIMFVPTEGLYAEILSNRFRLSETLHRDFKIIVVGPTNLVALLNSLQAGFRALAIERRSSEVWEILGAVKTEFGRFGDILEKTKKKLQEASNVIDDAGVRTRSIQKKLKNVEQLPVADTAKLLGTNNTDDLDDEPAS